MVELRISDLLKYGIPVDQLHMFQEFHQVAEYLNGHKLADEVEADR